MFKVWMLKKDNCDANEAHVGVEVYAVEDLVGNQLLNLCPKCFLAQMRLKAKGKRPEQAPPAPANGEVIHEFPG